MTIVWELLVFSCNPVHRQTDRQTDKHHDRQHWRRTCLLVLRRPDADERQWRAALSVTQQRRQNEWQDAWIAQRTGTRARSAAERECSAWWRSERAAGIHRQSPRQVDLALAVVLSIIIVMLCWHSCIHTWSHWDVNFGFQNILGTCWYVIIIITVLCFVIFCIFHFSFLKFSLS